MVRQSWLHIVLPVSRDTVINNMSSPLRQKMPEIYYIVSPLPYIRAFIQQQPKRGVLKQLKS